MSDDAEGGLESVEGLAEDWARPFAAAETMGPKEVHLAETAVFCHRGHLLWVCLLSTVSTDAVAAIGYQPNNANKITAYGSQ